MASAENHIINYIHIFCFCNQYFYISSLYQINFYTTVIPRSSATLCGPRLVQQTRVANSDSERDQQTRAAITGSELGQRIRATKKTDLFISLLSLNERIDLLFCRYSSV